jgi:hypothetical protein
MIVQECRAVDQGPGDVLGRRQPPGGRLLDAYLQVVAQLEQHRIHGHRALGLLEQASERGELGIDRCGGPAHAVRGQNQEGGNNGVESENRIPGQGAVGLNAFNGVKSELPGPVSLGPFARPSQLLRTFDMRLPYHTSRQHSARSCDRHRKDQTRGSGQSNSNVVHLAATAEQIDRQRQRIRAGVFGGGHANALVQRLESKSEIRAKE